MSFVRRLVVGGVAVGMAAVVAGLGTSLPTASASIALRGGFGGAVLVGDGEVFVGEASNSFRPNAVYIYRKVGTVWRQAATLTAPDAQVGDPFGSALALDGTRLFVGGGPRAVHVFTKQGTAWRHSATLSSAGIPAASVTPPGVPATTDTPGESPADSARFGTALAASGNWLLIGKAVAGGGRGRAGGGGGGGGGGGRGRGGAGGGTPQPPGAVYVFRSDAGGQYSYVTTLASADSTSAGDAFGSSIAMAGTVALIGARGQSDGAGVVHEFALDSTGAWRSQRSFAPQGLQAGDGFGTAVSLANDRAVVTAPGDAGGHGSAYAFRKVVQTGGRGRGGGGGGGGGGRGRGAGQGNIVWQEVARLAAPSGRRTDGFGRAIAADAREVWVGAPAAPEAGGVFVFAQDTSGFRNGVVRFLTPTRIEAEADVGQSISMRGNIAAVGATGLNRNAGGLLIFERDATGAWRAQPVITVPLDQIAPVTGSERRCGTDGKVGVFDCGNTQLHSFLPPSRLTHDGHVINLSGLWGWTDPQTGKEWALMGRQDGATFVDISNPSNPIPVADLPLTPGANPSSWREIKVYKDHAYIVSDGAGAHGMQVFDLTRLRRMRPAATGRPIAITPDTVYTEVQSSHNIVIDEESGFAYATGSRGGARTCGGGLHMIDIREPKKPTFAGCFAHTGTGRGGATGYTHDAQCVTYKGPDARYRGREICIGSNETALSIADVTDKQAPRALARATYPNTGYTHQGWFDDEQRYFYVNDELDETDGLVEKTRTLVWDFSDLENPRLAKEYFGQEANSDHNLYVRGNLMYQANYRAGLRILDITDRENPREVGYLDTAPFTANTPGFNGAWSVYPFFKSGTIIVNGTSQGMFIVRQRPTVF